MFVFLCIDLKICTPNEQWTYAEHTLMKEDREKKLRRRRKWHGTTERDKKSSATFKSILHKTFWLLNCLCRNWMLRIKLNKLLLCHKVGSYRMQYNKYDKHEERERKRDERRCIGRSWWTKQCNSWKMSVCHLRRTIC